jgi:uncharacterized protein (UPF0333 family)
MQFKILQFEIRGQTNVEFLILLGIAIVILITTIFVSQERVADVWHLKATSDARNSVDDLAAAAKDVYAQGIGAKKQVFIRLPSSYDPTNSFVTNKTIKINVAGSDYAATLSFDVHGSLPSSAGGHWVWVVSEGSRVRIGASMLEVDKSAISIMMNRNSTATASFDVKNVWGRQINVTLTKKWTDGNVTLFVSQTTFLLNDQENKTITINIEASESAVGFYIGAMEIKGTDGTVNETVNLPITVEVVGYGSTTTPPLTITPSSWNESILPDTTVIKSFSVCTNSQTRLSSVMFTTTGPAGGWVSGLDALPTMEPDTCLLKVFMLKVPNDTYPGVYIGTITGTGVGAANAEDTIALSINVGGNLSDILGPLVYNISRIPKRPFVGDPVTVVAVCDDTARGNNSIKSAEISINGSRWVDMLPADGAYNSPIERVTYTYYGLGFGSYNITIRCTDVLNNVGPNATYNFKIMKEILFVTKDLGASGSEQNWIDWLNTHSSNESFVWNKDVVHRNIIIDPNFDINMYGVVVLADGEVTSGAVGSQLVTKLINFIGAGGNVLLLDEALDRPAYDLGIATSSGSHTLLATSVRNNTHYITANLPYGSNYTIYTTATKIYHVEGLMGVILTTDYDYGEHLTHAQLGYGDHFVIWGASLPYRFNVAGNDLTVRVFDYAIMSSTVGTGR